MTKVSGAPNQFQMGPDYRRPDLKSSNPTGPAKYKDYKLSNPQTKYKDPMKQRPEYKPKQYQPSNKSYEYKPYEPGHIGIYGEKPREKKPRRPKSAEPLREIKPRRTFKCYNNPSGPDIKTNKMGPEYEVKEYKHPREYKLRPMPARPRSADPLRHRTGFVSNPVPYENKNYKLTETNNLGMRHWRPWSGEYIDDTVARRDYPERKEKYVAPEPRKAEQPIKQETAKPVVAAAIIPVKRAEKPAPKTFTNSSTQHYAPTSKSSATQTNSVDTKVFGTQYEPTKTSNASIQTFYPLPPIVPVPLSTSSARPPMKSTGVQCSEPVPKTRAFQTQTSPMIVEHPVPIVAQRPRSTRSRTPVQETRQEPQSTYNEPARRSPSPAIVPIVAVAGATRRSPTPVTRRTPTPTYAQKSPTPPPNRTITPEQPVTNPQRSPSTQHPTVVPIVAAAPPPAQRKATPPSVNTQNTPQQSIPEQTPQAPPPQVPVNASQPSHNAPAQPKLPPINNKSRLPPEVKANIEAYDSAHGPTGAALPTIQRSMKLAQ